jgi:hypothetical protein
LLNTVFIEAKIELEIRTSPFIRYIETIVLLEGPYLAPKIIGGNVLAAGYESVPVNSRSSLRLSAIAYSKKPLGRIFCSNILVNIFTILLPCLYTFKSDLNRLYIN